MHESKNYQDSVCGHNTVQWKSSMIVTHESKVSSYSVCPAVLSHIHVLLLLGA